MQCLAADEGIIVCERWVVAAVYIYIKGTPVSNVWLPPRRFEESLSGYEADVSSSSSIVDVRR